MGRPTLSDADVDAFRRAIVDASMTLFVERGFAGWSLRALAEKLGCSHATPYRYFDDKAAIFAAVRTEGFRRFAAFLRERVERERDEAARLEALARAYFAFAEQQPSAFKVTFEIGQPELDADDVVEAAADAWSVVLGVVSDAVAAGVLEGDVQDVAHTMWAGVHGVVTLHLAHKLAMGRTADDVLPMVVDALVRAHAPAKGEKR